VDDTRLWEHRRGNIEIPEIERILVEVRRCGGIVLHGKHAVQVGRLGQRRRITQVPAGDELVRDEPQRAEFAAVAHTGGTCEQARGQRRARARNAHHEHRHEVCVGGTDWRRAVPRPPLHELLPCGGVPWLHPVHQRICPAQHPRGRFVIA
jgi:hypothetical protein